LTWTSWLASGFALGVALWAGPLPAAPKAAVFPFDLRDAGQEGELVPQYNAEDIRRVKLVGDTLRSLMAKDGRYELVDLAPLAAEVEKAAPFNDCNGCEASIAEKAGADIAVTGLVNKFSDALISLQLYVRDVKSGEMKRTMSAAVQGNTDELWLHGLNWLWKNRFNAEEKKN
jgi:hypothetical protein